LSIKTFFILSIFSLYGLSLQALEIALSGAKDNFEEYSSIHLRDKSRFLCEEIKDDFDEVTQIVCAFEKQPTQDIKPLQNNFFEISTKTKNKTFFLIIKPYKKMKLFPMIFDLSKDDTVYNPKVDMAKHWLIVGYGTKLPYIKQEEYSEVSINFPFKFSKNSYPYVGSLDMQGRPVHVKRVGDVTDYIKVKKLYKKKDYEYCLDVIDDIIQDYPNSLFMAELLYYKIKCYAKLKNNDALIDVAKVYLREYSSDENIPEVLALVSRAYFQEGFNSDADYFFDRLFSEHADSVFAKWGLVYRGEMYEAQGASSKAVTSYEKALKKTKNIDVAVAAAFRLAKYYISAGEYGKAQKYVEKISKAKPTYFKEMQKESMDMMYDLADVEHYESAAIIAKDLSDEMGPTYDEYETLLRDRGIWLSKTSKKKEALEALNEYLKKFPDGDYEYEVQIAKDGLFFDVSDANFTTKLANYNKLIEEYSGDSIGSKAIYEKAKLLIQNKKYKDALDMEDQLLKLDSEEFKDIPKMINEAALGTMENALKNKECDGVLEISSQYKIELSDKWDDGVYLCAMKGADFALAKKMADKNLNSKNLEQRKKWLYRYIKIDFATGNYTDVIKASKELIALIQNDKNSKYLDVYRYLFDTYQRLENNEEMISSMAKIENIFGLDYKDIERYVTLIAVGSKLQDSNLVITYAKKVMQIQQRSDSYAQSPFVEFTLYQAYIDKEEYGLALDVIKSLEARELTKTQRARQKYLLGSVYERLWRDDEAKEAYNEAIKADEKSPWADLARSALKI
jgi:tetratricopeptide (TPR) repeat protein